MTQMMRMCCRTRIETTGRSYSCDLYQSCCLAAVTVGVTHRLTQISLPSLSQIRRASESFSTRRERVVASRSDLIDAVVGVYSVA